MGVPRRYDSYEDAMGMPTNLRNRSERVIKHLEQREKKDSPERGQEDPNDPGDEADTTGASSRDEDGRNVPKKPRNTLEREHERSDQGELTM